MGNKAKAVKESGGLIGRLIDHGLYWVGYLGESANIRLDKAKDARRHGANARRQSLVEVEETFDPKSEFLDSLKSWYNKPENQGKNILDYQAEDPDGLFAKLKGESHD